MELVQQVIVNLKGSGDLQQKLEESAKQADSLSSSVDSVGKNHSAKSNLANQSKFFVDMRRNNEALRNQRDYFRSKEGTQQLREQFRLEQEILRTRRAATGELMRDRIANARNNAVNLFSATSAATVGTVGLYNPFAVERFTWALKDLGAVIGRELEPTLNQMTKGIYGLADGFMALDPEVRKAIADTLVYTAALGGLVFVGGRLISTFVALKEAALLANAAVGGVPAVLKKMFLVGAGIAGLGFLADDVISGAMGKRIEGWLDQIREPEAKRQRERIVRDNPELRGKSDDQVKQIMQQEGLRPTETDRFQDDLERQRTFKNNQEFVKQMDRYRELERKGPLDRSEQEEFNRLDRFMKQDRGVIGRLTAPREFSREPLTPEESAEFRSRDNWIDVRDQLVKEANYNQEELNRQMRRYMHLNPREPESLSMMPRDLQQTESLRTMPRELVQTEQLQAKPRELAELLSMMPREIQQAEELRSMPREVLMQAANRNSPMFQAGAVFNSSSAMGMAARPASYMNISGFLDALQLDALKSPITEDQRNASRTANATEKTAQLIEAFISSQRQMIDQLSKGGDVPAIEAIRGTK